MCCDLCTVSQIVGTQKCKWIALILWVWLEFELVSGDPRNTVLLHHCLSTLGGDEEKIEELGDDGFGRY